MMKLSDFDYDLPKELIAQEPLKERDAARMLVINRASGSIEHRQFKDIVGYISDKDLLVLNDTKVLPARLIGRRKSSGKAEVLLLKQLHTSIRADGLKEFVFQALLRPARLKTGENIYFDGSNIECSVCAKEEVRIAAKDIESVYSRGVMPLPPYIKRQAQESDNIFYQTIYARQAGAIAAPTAGLHFSEDIFKKLREKGLKTAFLTLHVGYATFKPLKTEDISEHKMLDEYFKIPQSTAESINTTRSSGGRVIAVGTTSVRALETYSRGASEGFTDLFIYPGYKFEATDCILTNFHLPRTTLFALVCAFTGCQIAKKAYHEAINEKYRFYSYGDAMFII